MAAPLPEGALVRVVPQAPRVNPNDFVPPDPLAAVNTGLDLGQRLARLGDLSQQIKLEQLKRKSEMAQLTHAQALAEHETELIPKEMAARRAAAEATVATQTNVAAQQGALANLNVPQKAAAGAAVQAENALNSAVSATEFAKLSPEQQQAATQIAGLGIARAPGEDLNAWLQRGGQTLLRMKTTTVTPVSEIMPDGSVHTRNVPTNTVTGEVVGPKTDLGQTAFSPAERKLEQQLPVVTSLINVQKQAEELKPLLQAFKDKHKGLLKAAGQTTALKYANTQTTGALAAPFQSVLRVAGQAALDLDTQMLASKVQALSAPILKELIGGAQTPQELARLSSYALSVDDLTDPAAAIAKIDGLVELTKQKLATYTDRDVAHAIYPNKNAEEIRVDPATGKKYARRNGVVVEVP